MYKLEWIYLNDLEILYKIEDYKFIKNQLKF